MKFLLCSKEAAVNYLLSSIRESSSPRTLRSNIEVILVVLKKGDSHLLTALN